MTEPRRVEVVFTLEFKRSLRRLAKRYRSLRQDVDPLIERLLAGEKPGDRVPGTGFVVFKVRLANSDAQRGKSGGYRVLYAVEPGGRIVLVTLYSKSDQGDISTSALRHLLGDEPPVAPL